MQAECAENICKMFCSNIHLMNIHIIFDKYELCAGKLDKLGTFQFPHVSRTFTDSHNNINCAKSHICNGNVGYISLNKN